MSEPRLITAIGETPPSLARVEAPTRAPFRVGAVQEAWHADAEEHVAAIERGIAMAAGEGAQLVCLQELTLSPYFAIVPDALETAAAMAEPIPGGPTHELAARAAREHGIHVHASLYEQAADGGLGYNTAIVVAPSGDVVAKTRKLHIPVTAGYYEDRTSAPATTRRAIPSSSSATPASASRPAGTSGSRSSPAPTRSAAPR